jgi:peptidoglycan/LPS O-acetylase OafA/YrhL
MHPTATGPTGTGESALAYQPALDGLRAVAVATVLLFHLGVPWMPGGYLGVSVFFTLSGFLITSLLLRERAATGRVDAAAFWIRRVRRLAPATLLALAGVAVGTTLGWFATTRSLRAEMLGALFQVENWVALVAGRSYGDLFRAPSPVAHFWSLAIEEQWYWLWPLVTAAVLRHAARSRRPGHRTVVLFGAMFLVTALSAPVTAAFGSPELVYLATWTRAAEVLAGAVLAAAVAAYGVPRSAPRLAAPALLVVLVACVTTPTTGGWAYAGGLPLFALVSATLVLGLQAGSGVRRFLAVGPMVAIGRVSFGLYLFHWPVFVALDEARTGLTGPALGTLRLAVTAAITVASFRLIEQPVRRGRFPATPRRLVAAVGVTAALVGLVTVTTVDVPLPRRAPATLGAVAPPDRSARPTVDPTPVVAVLGDSVPAWLLADAAAGGFTRADVLIANGAQEACDGMVGLPVGRDRRGTELRPPPDCNDWRTTYPGVLRGIAGPPDVALLAVGQVAVVDRLVDGTWRSPCDGLDWYLRDLEQRVRFLRGHEVEPVLALPSWPGPNSRFMYPDDATERTGCVRNAFTTLATGLGAATVDLAETLCPTGPGSGCGPTTTDGVHVEAALAPTVLDRVLDATLRIAAPQST